MKNCQAIAVLATLLLFSMILGLSHGAPAGGNNDNSLNLLQNVSLSLHVLENVTLNTIKSEYMTLCKLGLEAAELTQEETELGLPAVTIQTAAQNLKDICKWVSTKKRDKNKKKTKTKQKQKAEKEREKQTYRNHAHLRNIIISTHCIYFSLFIHSFQTPLSVQQTAPQLQGVQRQ